MMNTERCISDADIGRLLEGDVTSQQKLALQEHIGTCPNCKARWEQACAGTEYMQAVLDKAKANCLSDDIMTKFISETLDTKKKHMVQEHLAQCWHCRDMLAERFASAYEEQGDIWWSEYVGQQILGLFARIPEEIDGLLGVLKLTAQKEVKSRQTINLSILMPAESQAMRLVAATGEGLSEQKLHQDDPPFDFHLVRFGQQLRIGVNATGVDSTYKNCLGKLKFYEADICKHSQVILIDKGEGQCVIEPENVRSLRPKEGQVAIKFIPIVTLAELVSVGTEAYRPILARLLKHEDPQIRKNVVEVVVRIYGPKAKFMIEQLAEDKDDAVRLAVQKALKQFSQ